MEDNCITVLVDDDTKDKLKKYSKAKYERTMSAQIRVLIHEFIEREENE